MDDEPWVIEDPSESDAAAEAAAAEAAAAEAAAAEAAAAAAAQAEAEAAAAQEAADLAEIEAMRARKAKICQHWVRPKFLQYNYMYDYRKNYYDDVIDYLDRRQRGVDRDVPRAQTWGERVLRTYTSKPLPMSALHMKNDKLLLSNINHGAKFYNYHSRAYITRTYSKALCLM